ncbi:hypothetical protein [Nocardiopsis lambiniae]|uniref:Uncharacterized protein n=1 Tax=Nocardiopsis lambiniae TaxID=3075539 RepID=A0ABU2M4I3_9ACTN|nr:hypothetical protein [Nocardiopsis sp. DSM 44743]MDT0327065.1 hypothetical protein [Nocardiopsis sp. DSM 44743]
MAAAMTACGGGETTPESMTVDAEVMCEDFVQRELDTAAEFSGTEATVADAEAWTYEVTGAVTYDGTNASYICTVATDETGEEWTLTDLTFE